MDFWMISTGERTSARMDRLCLELGYSSPTQSQRGRVFEAYVTWGTKWAADKETDCGLFWNAEPRLMGEWAQWPEALKFGNAMLRAGYIRRIEDESVYPKKLAAGRTGLVAWGELDKSWRGIHSDRRNKRELALFLVDPDKRSMACHFMRPPILSADWPGWVLSREEIMGGRVVPPVHGNGVQAGAQTGGDRSAVADDQAGTGFVPHHDDPGDGHVSVNATGYSGDDGGRDGPRGAPRAPASREDHVKKPNLNNRYVRQNDGKKTGKPKSEMQRAALENFRESTRDDYEMITAMCAIDSSPHARDVVEKCLRLRREFVERVLDELLERYDTTHSPAAAVMSRLEGYLRTCETRRERRDEQNHVRQGRGEPEWNVAGA